MSLKSPALAGRFYTTSITWVIIFLLIFCFTNFRKIQRSGSSSPMHGLGLT